MSHIKRIVSLILVFLLLISTISCKKEDKEKKPNIDNEVEYKDMVKEIDWSKLDTSPLSCELAQGLIYLLNNGMKYMVNDWWNLKWEFNKEDNNDYLKMKGNNEHSIRPLTHQARTLAACLVLNIYDEDYTKVSKEEATNMALKLIKSLAKSHYSNTKGGWGDEWQSAYWAADLAHAGWLLWDKLEDSDKEYVRNATEKEANRFLDYKVPYYKDKDGNVVYAGDSKAEENAWNSNILSVALAMMPDHENYNAWMSKNMELIISSFARPSNLLSDDSINGYRLSTLLQGSNINEDGTVVNHNIVHPDYQATVAINFLNGIFFAFASMEIPKAFFFNGDVIYESFVDLDLKDINKDLAGKYMYDRDSNKASYKLNYPNGTDWGYDRQICFFLVDVFADILNMDKNTSIKAFDFAKARLPVMKAMQDRNDNGMYYTDSDDDKYQSREEWVMWHAIVAYMALFVDANDLFNITSDYPIKTAPLTKITLDLSSELKINNSYQVKYKLSAGNLELPEGSKIEIEVDNTDLAEIVGNEYIKTKAEGKVKVTITLTYGDIVLTDSKEITIVENIKDYYDFEDSIIPDNFIWNEVGLLEIVDDNGNKVIELSGSGYNYVFIGDDFDGDFSVNFKLRITNHIAKGGAHLLFREDPDKFTGRHGYQVCYGSCMNNEFGLEIRKREVNLSDNLFESLEDDGLWHSFTLVVIGENISLFIDGEEIMKHSLSGFDSGVIVIASYLDTVQFDDIEIIYN